jgi:hypothetical protein
MKHYKLFIVALCALFIVACGGGAANTGKDRTPIETLKALNEASKKKDADGIKKLLSKGTLKLLDEAAQKEKTTPDELLRREGGAPMATLPEIRGEKIEGDTAYVEIKNDITNEDEKMPLVKEDGEWKVALDKYLEVMKQRFTEEMNKMENSNTSLSNSGAETNTTNKTNKQ